MLPGPARRIVAQPVVYRPLLMLEERLCARSEGRGSRTGFDATILVNPEETEELTRRSGSSTVSTLLPLLPEPRSRPVAPVPGGRSSSSSADSTSRPTPTV